VGYVSFPEGSFSFNEKNMFFKWLPPEVTAYHGWGSSAESEAR